MSKPRVKLSADEHLSRLVEVGISLSAETNLERLLEKIVTYARELTLADAGTLYTLEEDRLHFKIIQNDTLGIFRGGATGEALSMEPVPLNRSMVSGYVALTGEFVNIEDVYSSDKFDFAGPKKYDERTGYRSRSMLVAPMRDHEGEVIGVLQLLNATDPETGASIPFAQDVENLTRAFASQAAIALTNAKLISEVRDLFESLIRVLAAAVDAKSPYTGNHVQRVALLNYLIAASINEASDGPFSQVRFTDFELDEMRLAGWLHDVGKVTTPTWVMDKSTKLQTIFDRIGLVETRFSLIAALLENEALKARLTELGHDPQTDPALAPLAEDKKKVAEDFAYVARVNEPREFMDDAMLARLEEIRAKTYTVDGVSRNYLTDEEALNLAIRKGSLNDDEMQTMRDHVRLTAHILKAVPFGTTRHMKKVPLFASQHHEKLSGLGYPEGISAEELPLQSRILAIADFYEALSAKDRPYKKPMPLDLVVKIMRKAAEDREIDSEVLEFMLATGIHTRFEEEYEKKKSLD